MTNNIPKDKIHSRQQELANAFNFTSRDLAANRQSRVTEAQKKKVMQLQGGIWNPIIRLLAIILIIVFVLFCGVFTFALVLNDTDTVGVGVDDLLGGGIMYLILFSSIIVIWYFRHRMWEDLQAGIVETIHGITIVEIDPRSFAGSVTIHNIRLQAKRECVLRIKHLEPHVIHYLPNSKVIVSVEVMEQ